jgi:hydroxypyruvate reductase
MFDAAVAAADPARVLPPHLPAPPRGRTIVLGAGKASARMAQVIEQHWPGPLEGLVVTAYGHAVPCRHIEIVEAAHPVPDEAGVKAARRILELARAAGEDDLVLAPISGGGSALLTLPAAGLSLADKRAINQALLRSGATIHEINTVRKHLSGIKGGKLAAAAFPARTLALLISDVPGDDPAVIASGPTVPDPTTCADALAVLDRYGIDPPPAVRAHLERCAEETPKPGDPRLARAETRIIARPQDSLLAAAEVARSAGYTPLLLGDASQVLHQGAGHETGVGEGLGQLPQHELLAHPLLEGDRREPPLAQQKLIALLGEAPILVKGFDRPDHGRKLSVGNGEAQLAGVGKQQPLLHELVQYCLPYLGAYEH